MEWGLLQWWVSILMVKYLPERQNTQFYIERREHQIAGLGAIIYGNWSLLIFIINNLITQPTHPRNYCLTLKPFKIQLSNRLIHHLTMWGLLWTASNVNLCNFFDTSSIEHVRDIMDRSLPSEDSGGPSASSKGGIWWRTSE